jgi:signal peptidase I
MAPTLRPGDRLLVRPLAGAPPPSEGEIVVTRRGTRLVTHRLVMKMGDLAITRGDACRALDPPVSSQALLGRVVLVRRSSQWTLPWHHLRLMVNRIRRNL